MADYVRMKSGELPVKLAKKIIENEPEEFRYLKPAGMQFYWVAPDMKKKGRPCVARVRRVGGIWAAVTDLDFIMQISTEAWNSLPEVQKTAVLRHELRHCGVAYNNEGSPLTISGEPVPVDEQGNYILDGLRLKYTLVEHDIEMFLADIREKRLPGIEHVARALGVQLEFGFKTETKTENVA